MDCSSPGRLLSTVYFQRKLWWKHLQAPGLWSWRCHTCREVVTMQIILWKRVSPGCREGWKKLRTQEIFGKKSASKAWQEPKTPRWFLPNSHLSPPLPQGADTGQGHHTHPRKTSPHQQGIRLSFASRSSSPKTSLPEVSPVPNGRFPSGLLNAGLLRFFKTLLGWVK